jgi:hypothetical protein
VRWAGEPARTASYAGRGAQPSMPARMRCGTWAVEIRQRCLSAPCVDLRASSSGDWDVDDAVDCDVVARWAGEPARTASYAGRDAQPSVSVRMRRGTWAVGIRQRCLSARVWISVRRRLATTTTPSIASWCGGAVGRRAHTHSLVCWGAMHSPWCLLQCGAAPAL